MRTVLKIFVALLSVSFSASAQQPTLKDSLLDQLTGNWVLQGTIAGRETTHDIESEWVLGHHYVQFHELSREKNAQGQAAYEAIVFIGWDEASSEYACLWLDTTGGGLSAQAIGHAKRSGDEIALLFKGKDGSSFHTKFAYSKSTDTWQWFMDDEEGGKRKPFARVKLTRK
ncbi:MAG: DUF1579 family protein [Acidobacteriia bacterium]|nr:DUF1579 family protein [Terriglobia bacterium]